MDFRNCLIRNCFNGKIKIEFREVTQSVIVFVRFLLYNRRTWVIRTINQIINKNTDKHPARKKMSEKIKWGLLATGAIAQAFARGVKQSETGTLYAVASRDKKKADDFAKEFGAQIAYGSYEEMLSDPQVNAVYVSTPHPMHVEWVLKALDAGKHVICEKPAGVNQWELQKMLAFAAEKNLFFMEAYMYRCHPQTAKLVELISEGAIGRVCAINATFSFGSGFNPESRLWKNDLGGGGILDVGGYTTSVVRLIAGAALGKDFAEPKEVRGVAALANETGIDAWASAVLKFDNDIVATCHTGVGVSQDNIVKIFGSAGSVTLPDPYVADRVNPSAGKIIVKAKGKEQIIDIPCGVTTYALEADAAGRAIIAGKTEAAAPAMSWADSLGNLRAQDAWRETAGLVYNYEKPEAVYAKCAANPAKVRANPSIPRCKIPGLDKTVSRLIMGVDNHTNAVATDTVFGAFYERGGNTFDTAWVYGDTRSRVLGNWINANKLRGDIAVIAKGAHTPECFPDKIRPQLDTQLGWLNTDYADIYMMHRDNPAIPAGEFIDALNELVKEGKIKVFGGSNWSLDRVAEANAYAAQKGVQGFSVVSNNLALAEMVKAVWDGCIHCHARADRDRLAALGVTLLPWSSQARGFFMPSISAPNIRNDRSLVESWYSEDNFKRQARAIELAAKYGVEPINIALAWVLNQKFPVCPLIGPRSVTELQSSISALPVKLTDAEMAWVNLEN